MRKLLTTKANKIFIDEILPLVTKAFSSITSEIMSHPQYWSEEDGKMKKLFEGKAEMFVSDFKKYVEGTIELQYKVLTTLPTKNDDLTDTVTVTSENYLTGKRKTKKYYLK